jgi:hypothetical protein
MLIEIWWGLIEIGAMGIGQGYWNIALGSMLISLFLWDG